MLLRLVDTYLQGLTNAAVIRQTSRLRKVPSRESVVGLLMRTRKLCSCRFVALHAIISG
jgi:hypothetical protein